MEKVYVFGCGHIFRKNIEQICSNYEIYSILDNSVADNETIEINGRSFNICNPRRVSKNLKHSIIICIANFIEAWKQLKDLGIEDRMITINPALLFDWNIDFDNIKILSRYDHMVLIYDCEEYVFFDNDTWQSALRNLFRHQHNLIEYFSNIDLKPISRNFGCERGRAVDRVYIEDFLKANSHCIKGSVLEVADSTYTDKFGADVSSSTIIHVNGWGKNVIKGNFETGEGLDKLSFDCIICTQVLQYIYDINSAIHNIYKLLKPNGTALITVPGIKSISLEDDRNWNEYWSFTPKSVERLCSSVSKNYHIIHYGNVKITSAYLYGICAQDLSDSDFEYNDYQFPFLIGAVIKREDC